MYLDDLAHATEIVLHARNRVRPLRDGGAPHLTPVRGSASRAAASALRIGNTVGAALTNRRVLGVSEAGIAAKFGLLLTVLAVLAVVFPRLVAVPVGIVAGWIGLSLLVRARRLRRRREAEVERPIEAAREEKAAAPERR
jgi:cardiolipin synthase